MVLRNSGRVGSRRFLEKSCSYTKLWDFLRLKPTGDIHLKHRNEKYIKLVPFSSNLKTKMLLISYIWPIPSG